MIGKRGVGFFALMLFVMAVFLSSPVFGATVFETIFRGGGGFGDFLANLQDSLLFTQLLIFILVWLVVYSALGFIPVFSKKPGVLWIASAVIAILSTFYLDTTEVATILLSYTALGIVLSGIIPFLLLLAVSKKLDDGGYSVFSKVIWVIFAIVLFFRWLVADSGEFGVFGVWGFPIIVILSLLFAFFGGAVWERVREGKAAVERKAIGRGARNAAATQRASSQFFKGAGEGM